MKVVILTEGGNDKGFGHVARCSSIYQAFVHFNVSVDFIIDGDDSIKSIINEIDYISHDWLNDLSIINEADIVVIDSYLANVEIYNEISKNVSLIVSIDDNNRINYPKGIIVNGTLDVSNMEYIKRDGIKYLVGKDFIPLRNDFWEIPKLKINDDIKNILITMGGNDLRNLIPKILKSLNNNFSEVHIKIIIAKSFNNISEIESLKNNHVELIYSPDSEKMLNLMLNTDLAISSSGQTLYELARIGVPTIAIGIIDNQKNNIKNWQNTGFIEYAGCWNDQNLFNVILKKIELLKDKNIRCEKRLKGINAVDGKGSLRIVKAILNEYYEKNSIFREIRKEDCLKIFEIANDDEVRKSSFNTESIELEDHKRWFNNILRDNSTKFYVLESNEEIIGQIRFDFDEEYPVISISLNKKYRGLGLSKYLLYKGMEFLEDYDSVVAYIKKDNLKSISFFKSMGFKKESEVVIKDSHAFKFIKEKYY